MANVNVIASPYIVHGETSITDNVFKDDGANDMVKGGLYYLSNGAMVPVEATQGSAQVIDTDDTAFATAHRFFISMADKTADGGFVTVTEIDEDSILEGFVVDHSGTTVEFTTAYIGDKQSGYVTTAGLWAINADASKGVFEITDVDSNYDPYRNPDSSDFDEDSGGVRHGRVKFKIAKSVLA